MFVDKVLMASCSFFVEMQDFASPGLDDCNACRWETQDFASLQDTCRLPGLIGLIVRYIKRIQGPNGP